MPLNLDTFLSLLSPDLKYWAVEGSSHLHNSLEPTEISKNREENLLNQRMAKLHVLTLKIRVCGEVWTSKRRTWDLPMSCDEWAWTWGRTMPDWEG